MEHISNISLKSHASICSNASESPERRRDYGNPREKQADRNVIKNLEEQMEKLDIQEENYYAQHEDDPNNEWCEPQRVKFKEHLVKIVNEMRV